MARISYLFRRDATYYARIDVPTDLVAHYGTSTRKRSLRSKDESEAKRRLWPVIEAWRAEFDDVRRRLQMTEHDKAAAVWQHYTGALDRDEQTRQQMPTPAEIEAERAAVIERAERGEIASAEPLAVLDATLELQVMQGAREHEAKSRRVKLDTLRKHLATGETALVAHEANTLQDRASPDWQDVARRLVRAEIEALQRTIERDGGDYSGTPRDPLVRPATGSTVETAAPGERITDLFETYIAENPRGITVDTLNQARRDIGTFLNLHGATFPVQRLDKKAVREWKALLLKFPVKATESNVFAGMSIAKIVEHNKKVGKPTITNRTINRYLSSMAAFCNWLVSHGYIDNNPCDGMFLAKENKTTTVPFGIEQLKTLFRSPLFTGCQSADEWRLLPKAGNVLIRDHRYWLPLVMLFSGARPAEIAQLNVADVRQEHGRWIMHITPEGGADKSVKTAGSARVVPIHPELVALGFLDHHATMKRAGETRLFPEAKRNSRNQMIAEFSRQFPRYLARIGLKEGRGLSLYSFRHGAADALRRAGHLDEQFGYLFGHTGATMTGRYGMLPQGMLEQRVALVESIRYPDLDLSHLHYSS